MFSEIFGPGLIFDKNTLKTISNGQTNQTNESPKESKSHNFNDQLETYLSNTNVETKNEQKKRFKFVERPNFGKLGRPIKLECNHFRLILPSVFIYHYEMDINPPVSKLASKKIYEKIVQEHDDLFKDVLIVYDNEKNIYAKKILPGIGEDKVNLEIKLGEKRKFEVTINFKTEIDLEFLKEILERKLVPTPSDLINLVDTLMRYLPSTSLKYFVIDKSFFNSSSLINNSLSSGKEVCFGWIQQVVPSHWNAMTLKVDTTASPFYKPQSVLNFLCEALDFSYLDRKRSLNDFQRNTFTRRIRGLKIEINYGTTKRKYKVVNVLKKPLYLQTFMLNQDNGIVKEIYVAQYFKEKYNIELEYLNLPCLQVGNEHRQVYIPVELCSIMKGQRCLKRLTDTQTSTMIRSTAISAPERREEIKKIIKEANFNCDESKEQFGIKINSEMESVTGRILNPPLLQYSDRVIVEPKRGIWNMAKKKFFIGCTINKFALVCFSPQNQVKETAIRFFIDQLISISRNVGMQIINRPCFCKYATDIKQVDQILEYLIKTFDGLQMVLFILPGKTAIYSEIKRLADTVYGIPTQCIQSKNVINCSPQTLSNICMKINTKLSGVNLVISPEYRLRAFNEPVIFVAADLTKLNEPRKSVIVSLVGSMDGHPSRYSARISVQQTADEIIDLCEMFKSLLIQFYQETRFKPHKIIFYRQGILNQKLLETIFVNELTAIRNCCLSLEDGYKPGITYVHVMKRHHTRLFCKDTIDQGKGGNITAGTTVDTGISHPTEFDFFLCSHSGIQGTSRPSYYHVLWDDNKFTADEFQALTYQLCYTYARCTRSVSLPTPVLYAQLVIRQAKIYLLDPDILRRQIFEMQKQSYENLDQKDAFLFDRSESDQEILQAMKLLLTLHSNSLSNMFFA